MRIFITSQLVVFSNFNFINEVEEGKIDEAWWRSQKKCDS
jgi:hypothetical protein